MIYMYVHEYHSLSLSCSRHLRHLFDLQHQCLHPTQQATSNNACKLFTFIHECVYMNTTHSLSISISISC